MMVAAAFPNVTEVISDPFPRCMPVMVIYPPPANGPLLGVTLLMMP